MNKTIFVVEKLALCCLKNSVSFFAETTKFRNNRSSVIVYRSTVLFTQLFFVCNSRVVLVN